MSPKPSQATLLVDLAADEGIVLFHNGGTAYGTVEIESHFETWPLATAPIRQWLARLYFRSKGAAPSSQALADALAVLQGQAIHDGQEIQTQTRIAFENGVLYLDIGDPDWRIVRIDGEGWQVLSDAPVRFRRPSGLQALPVPVAGGSIEALRPFVNVADDDDWRLLVAWLVGAFSPRGSYPILVLMGEQGTAKSTTARVLRSLIDPNAAPVRSAPREERDLMIAARHSRVLAFDNLSGVPPWLSDSLCRISSGGGLAVRSLYTDSDETIINVCRPIVLNSITEVATRSDILDRAILVSLPVIPENARRPEAEFWSDFEQAQPLILGALLDTVAAALANKGKVKLARLPRMADFALWVAGAERALGWEEGSFLASYTGNRGQANELALESSVVGPAVVAMFAEEGPFEGAAKSLLDKLATYAAEAVHAKGWPDAPRLSKELTRIAPNLRSVGINFARDKRNGRRVLLLERCEP